MTLPKEHFIPVSSTVSPQTSIPSAYTSPLQSGMLTVDPSFIRPSIPMPQTLPLKSSVKSHPGTRSILGPYAQQGDPIEPIPVPRTINGIEPEIYGPFTPDEAKKASRDALKKKDDLKKNNDLKHKVESNSEKPLLDDGTHSSDKATKTHSIYFYQPFASLPFPENNEAPQPYLNDFMPFQK